MCGFSAAFQMSSYPGMVHNYLPGPWDHETQALNSGSFFTLLCTHLASLSEEHTAVSMAIHHSMNLALPIIESDTVSGQRSKEGL